MHPRVKTKLDLQMRLKFLDKKLREPDHSQDQYEEWESNKETVREELEKVLMLEFKHFLNRWIKTLSTDGVLDIAVTCMFAGLDEGSQALIANRWYTRLYGDQIKEKNKTDKKELNEQKNMIAQYHKLTMKYERQIGKLQVELDHYKQHTLNNEKWIIYMKDLMKKDSDIKKLIEDNPSILESKILPKDSEFIFVGNLDCPNLIRWQNIEIGKPVTGSGYVAQAQQKYPHLNLSKKQIQNIKKKQIESGKNVTSDWEYVAEDRPSIKKINSIETMQNSDLLLVNKDHIHKSEVYVAELLDQIERLKKSKNEILDDYKKSKINKETTD